MSSELRKYGSTSVVHTPNIGFTSEVSDYLVVHTGPEVVRARHAIIWTGQDYPTGNSSRRETKRQTEETMGKQHQRVDWS